MRVRSVCAYAQTCVLAFVHARMYAVWLGIRSGDSATKWGHSGAGSYLFQDLPVVNHHSNASGTMRDQARAGAEKTSLRVVRVGEPRRPWTLATPEEKLVRLRFCKRIGCRMDGRIGNRNSHSLDEKQQHNLLDHVCFMQKRSVLCGTPYKKIVWGPLGRIGYTNSEQIRLLTFAPVSIHEFILLRWGVRERGGEGRGGEGEGGEGSREVGDEGGEEGGERGREGWRFSNATSAVVNSTSALPTNHKFDFAFNNRSLAIGHLKLVPICDRVLWRNRKLERPPALNSDFGSVYLIVFRLHCADVVCRRALLSVFQRKRFLKQNVSEADLELISMNAHAHSESANRMCTCSPCDLRSHRANEHTSDQRAGGGPPAHERLRPPRVASAGLLGRNRISKGREGNGTMKGKMENRRISNILENSKLKRRQWKRPLVKFIRESSTAWIRWRRLTLRLVESKSHCMQITRPLRAIEFEGIPTSFNLIVRSRLLRMRSFRIKYKCLVSLRNGHMRGIFDIFLFANFTVQVSYRRLCYKKPAGSSPPTPQIYNTEAAPDLGGTNRGTRPGRQFQRAPKL
ncbi:hypothetical protein EVAR_96456_1 [Eumeta japonica]|uniref:Uncharacterized protein n=1 Tax=Eumeta variegata TaxID=151549 RepID=A0A4C1VXJ1_EUMVA|nr:hypothetical protein EVAR_96456_1 [Eumeta japonica]